MNKLVLAVITVGILIAGLIFCPIFVRCQVAQAQVQARLPSPGIIGDCRDPYNPLHPMLPTKKVTLIASENFVQVFPSDVIHPGGMWYHAMVFNGTIPG